ncbi:hypothetical protein [Nesterenkonia sp. PF2B19]|uniref:hypothetical protein n=1 Tax=Nesterenkonia sp. PF2B19 TaxID=1881858 RepID=UPI000872AF4F|nr:hypothetical protein [Nesterenkonia sp. PF2B19]OSM43480.1 hypothetical protein BCY76_008150 [Nesterenkonia sp. PF2B19]
MIRLYRAVCRLVEAHADQITDAADDPGQPQGAESTTEHAGHPEPFELRGGIARTQDDLDDGWDDRSRPRIGFTRRNTR